MMLTNVKPDLQDKKKCDSIQVYRPIIDPLWDPLYVVYNADI
jgi:hypothetical protein